MTTGKENKVTDFQKGAFLIVLIVVVCVALGYVVGRTSAANDYPGKVMLEKKFDFFVENVITDPELRAKYKNISEKEIEQ